MRGASARGSDPRGAYQRAFSAQTIESYAAGDELWGKADAVAIAASAATATDTISDALAKAAAVLFESAESSSLLVGAATGVTQVFVLSNGAQASDNYSAAAQAYASTVEITDAEDQLDALAKAAATLIESAGSSSLIIGAETGVTQVFVLNGAQASDDYSAAAQAYASTVEITDAEEAVAATRTVLGQIQANAISEDQLGALAKAAATLIESAGSSSLIIGAETGVTPVFMLSGAQASDDYSAAAQAYASTIGITNAEEAMAATAKALASYASHTQASDSATASASTDSTGPLRGSIKLVASLRGQVWLVPSPGPKGGRPH